MRQGLGRHHAALLAGQAAGAAAARRPARLGRVQGDRLGRGAGTRHAVARRGAPARSEEARVLHRPRPEPGADRLVGDAVRHAQLCRARRLLLGQHGGGGALHLRRLVLGVRRDRLGPHPLFHAVRRRRGSRVEPDQDRARQAEEARREGGVGEPRAHRLQRDCRRMDRHQARHRRPVRRRAGARAADDRADRCRVPGALHQRALAGDPRSRQGGRRAVRARRRRQSAGARQGYRRAQERARGRR